MNLDPIDILLVEDSLEDAELTMRVLKKHNVSNSLLHLQDGEEALNYLFALNPKNLPKLMLLDLKMPKVDGFEVLKKIKCDEFRKIIPIVLLTSSKEEKDIVESYKIGVNAYIVKPVGFEKFAKVVSDIGLFWLFLNQPPHF